MDKVKKTYGDQTREVWCLHCDAMWTDANALAVGARHTSAFGHTVEVRVSYSVTYSKADPPRRATCPPAWHEGEA